MTEWKEYKLKDVIEKFIDYRGKTPKKTTEGIPLITAKIVKKGTIEIPNEFIHPDDYESWMTRGFPKVNDVVMTTEAPLGEVALIKNDSWALAQRIITMRGNPDLCNNIFLKYYLQSRDGQAALQARASGSTVEGIKASELREMTVFLPDIDTQESIGDVLISLDNKIDLLHRQNQTLEAMAETLFRQWFIEEAEESWEDGETYLLGDLIDTISETYKFKSEKIVFLNTSDISSGQIIERQYSDVITLPGQAKKRIQQNDILFSEIRPANKRFAYVDFDVSDFVVSTKLMVLRSKGIISPAIIYFYLTHPQTLAWLQMLAESRSGTFPQITFDQVKEMKINVPKGEMLEKMTNWTENSLAKISKNHTQIRTLTQLRDTLLPKLMSGEVRVEM